MVRRNWMAAMLLLGAGATVLVVRSGGKSIDPDDARQVAAGAALYQAHCAKCHGAGLQGEPEWRTRKPDGVLPAPPHDASGHTWHHPDDHLFAVTKHGSARFAPPEVKTGMPGFIGILDDGEIRAVLAFIKSSWPPELRQRQEAVNQR